LEPAVIAFDEFQDVGAAARQAALVNIFSELRVADRLLERLREAELPGKRGAIRSNGREREPIAVISTLGVAKARPEEKRTYPIPRRPG
jgi:hypothetical protein